MAQGYYTLEEAAQHLGMSVDDLKMVARRGEVRAFQDRGTWRFRVQDIEEMARRRGIGSDPELPLGESAAPRPTDSPAPRSGPKSPGPKSPRPKSPGPKSPGPKSPRPKSSSKLGGADDVFDFSLEIEDEASTAGKPSSKKNQPKTPQPGSDSDVRLVGGEDDFNLEVDSDVKVADTPRPPGPSSKLGPKKSGLAGPASKKSGLGGSASPRPSSRLSGKGKSGLASPPSPRPRPSKVDPKRTAMGSTDALDSGVRLVPMDSDSDVRIVPPDEGPDVPLGAAKPPSGTDSDVRMEAASARPPDSDEEMLTEEINLDEELRRQEKPRPPAGPPQAKVRPGPRTQQSPQLPTTSPFELSEPELTLPASDEDIPTSSPTEGSSSDFDLTPAGQSSSPLDSADDDFNLELPDEGVALGEAPAGLKGPASGINLDNPIDSGISLEQGGAGSDEIEFELTLDAEGASKTPGPAPAQEEGSSSEFELTLDADDAKMAPNSDSEFELTLGVDDSSSGETPAAGASSSSEFELTLDGGEEGPAAGELSASSDSDFEMTAEGGEGSAAAELSASSDSDFEMTLEASDSSSPVDGSSDSEFELSLDDSSGSLEADAGATESESESGDIFETDFDAAPGDDLEESGSEAVALDEGDTDLESSDFDIALGEGDVEAEDESGSQVVALEDEDEDFAPAPRSGRRGRRAPTLDEEEPGFEGLGGEEREAAAEEEEAEEPAAPVPAVVSAPWGPLPVAFMLPCVVVMFLVGLMGFELIQGMSGHHPPGMITKAISGLIMPK